MDEKMNPRTVAGLQHALEIAGEGEFRVLGDGTVAIRTDIGSGIVDARGEWVPRSREQIDAAFEGVTA